MQKTPITIEEDLKKLEKDAENEICAIKEEMEEFFRCVTGPIDKLLNPVIASTNQSPREMNITPTNQKGAAKPDPKKAPPAKGKPDPKKGTAEKEVAAFESPLPTTTAGIESVIFLIDKRIETLPFESMNAFEKVSAAARDFNLHMHMSRLNAVGHKAELHNNQGLSRDDLHYIVDMPDNEELKEKAEQFITKDMGPLMPGSTWNGILTHKQHIPSEGEW